MTPEKLYAIKDITQNKIIKLGHRTLAYKGQKFFENKDKCMELYDGYCKDYHRTLKASKNDDFYKEIVKKYFIGKPLQFPHPKDLVIVEIELQEKIIIA